MSNSNGFDPKKIAMLGSFPPVRALSSYCLELARAIADLGKIEFISFKKIYPAAFYPGGDLNDDNTFPEVGHPHLKIRRRLIWYNPATWISEGVLAPGVLLHAQWWSLPLSFIYLIVCLGFKIRRRPIVFTVHNILPHETSFFYKMICTVLFKLVNHFIVHSEKNQKQLISLYNISPKRVTQIPHGPLDFHVQSDIDRELVRQKMGFQTEHRIILIFGAIRPYKGIDIALKAFSKVVVEIPEARLLIAGKLWEDWETYRRLIKELKIGKHIKTYLRYIPSREVCVFFEVSDLVILPYNQFDSQSGVGATAVSFRKPMIVTNVGGLHELVADQRCVVPPKDPETLARTIFECLDNPNKLKEMSEGARLVAEKMAWPIIAKKTWAVYEKVLVS